MYEGLDAAEVGGWVGGFGLVCWRGFEVGEVLVLRRLVVGG